MRLSDDIIKSLIWIFILLGAFFSFTVENNRFEIVIFITLSLAIFLLHIFLTKGVLTLTVNKYHTYLATFCAFCYLSSLWAINTTLSIGKGNTLLEIFILMSVIYLCAYQEHDCVNKLLKTIMWASFFSIIYIILVYGVSNVLLIVFTGGRFDNEVLNANRIGMTAAFSILLALFSILYEGFHFWNIMVFPAAAVCIASASRKAYFIIAFGFILLLLFKNFKNRKHFFKKLLKAVPVIIGIIVFMYALSEVPFLQYSFQRFNNLFYLFNDNAKLLADNSSLTRLKLVEMGIDIFRNNFILGVGIDNATEFVAWLFQKEYYYLHNNYIELLADGGLIGFGLYYWFYVYLLFLMFKYRDFDDKNFNITFTLLILFFILDMGMVSYTDKNRYLFLMVIYLQQLRMRKVFFIKNKF